MATLVDRATLLRGQATPHQFTGIDFIRIEEPCDQTVIRIYLITDATLLGTKFVTPDDGATNRPLTPDSIVIESLSDPSLPPIPVLSIATNAGSQVLFDAPLDRHYLEITVAEPGKFGRYQLQINDPAANTDLTQAPFSRIDRFFNDKTFSFKVGCEDDLDCAPPTHDCPPETPVDFAVDYLARDFVSLRGALLEFAAQRYPQWTLPIEADVGMMLAEIMAALGDEFSYIQDRNAREAFLETASQRRSLRKKARLLDFEIHDGRSASTWLDFTVDLSPGLTTLTGPPTVQAGSRVFALSESGARIPFEVGLGLRDRAAPSFIDPTLYKVREEWNAGALPPYLFDASQACLPVGSTELFVLGTVANSRDLIADSAAGEKLRRMLLRTDPSDLAVPARTFVVGILEITEMKDPLMAGSPTVTRIRWDPADALPFELDQSTLVISFNILPATAGETVEERFVARASITLADDQLPTVDREGALKLPSRERETITTQDQTRTRPVTVLYGIQRTEQDGLGFLGDDLRHSAPEIEVLEDSQGGLPWTWVQSLVEAPPLSTIFTLEDGVWRRIRGFRRIGGEVVHRDYATGSGFSVRFGDNEFGQVPNQNQPFKARYRTGPGTHANVAPGTINALFDAPQHFGQLSDRQWWIKSTTNPLPVSDGVDPETAREIRQLAPEAYQAEVFFAVQPKDYGQQVERFDFVQRAQGTARWTGSWQTMFVAADPFGATNLLPEQRATLEAWLGCVRQSGRDVIVRDPKTVAVDLQVLICIEPTAYAAHVVPLVEEILLGRGLGGRPKGFFHPDNFTFGTPLRRSALEAAIQSVPGVRSVRRTLVRLRGVRRFRALNELTLKVGPDQILRLDNDATRPEAGTLRLFTEGGA